MKPAPAEETLNKRSPSYDDNEQISPSGIKLRSKRTKPPECERKPQNPVYFAQILIHIIFS